MGSVTPPQKINKQTYDYPLQQENKGNLHYNQQWALDPLNLDKNSEEIKPKTKLSSWEVPKGELSHSNEDMFSVWNGGAGKILLTLPL